MRFLLLLFCLGAGIWAPAQTQPVGSLPAGRYVTSLRPGSTQWSGGDIIIIDSEHYRISSAEDVGEYRFSAAAQRIFFTSGPLRAAFAKTLIHGGRAAIELPFAQNSHQNLASADVLAVLRQ